MNHKIIEIEEEFNLRIISAIALIHTLDPALPPFSHIHFPTPLLFHWPRHVWTQHMIEVAKELEDIGEELNENYRFFFSSFPKLILQFTAEVKGYAHTIPTDDGRRSSYLKSCLILHAEILLADKILGSTFQMMKTRLNEKLQERKAFFQPINQIEPEIANTSAYLKVKPVEDLISKFEQFVKGVCYSLCRQAKNIWITITLLDNDAVPIDPTSDDIVSIVTLRTENSSLEFVHSKLKISEHGNHFITGESSTIDNTQIRVDEQIVESSKGIWKNLPPKVLLLDKLDFFKLPAVAELSNESRGRLVSILCGGSSDNAVDYIRECDHSRLSLSKNPYRNPKNIQAVEDLLAELNSKK